METIPTVFVIWGFYLTPFLPIAAAVWFFGRRRVQWNRWDFALVVLPFAVWMALMMVNSSGKSISNLAEAFWLGCAAPLAPIIRVSVGQKTNQKVLAIGMLVVVCLAAVGLWALVPGLPG